jgi:hypothetical protein
MLQLVESVGGIWWPMFLFFINPASYIPNHILSLENKIRILENKKKALLEEEQSLIMAAAHHGEPTTGLPEPFWFLRNCSLICISVHTGAVRRRREFSTGKPAPQFSRTFLNCIFFKN